MYVICHYQKPVTLERLYTLNNDEIAGRWRIDERQYDLYLAHKTKKGVIALYLYHFGFTWTERPEGISALKLV